MTTSLIYLAAVVAANLSAATFGPGASVINAFAFIGLDLTLRDRLHDEWLGQQLGRRMAILIAIGGLFSFLINAQAGQIAIASSAAFALAATLDGVTYEALGGRSRLLRVNGSNVAGAAVDSLVFPTLAFGGLMPAIVIGQFAAKVLGGFVWSVLLAVPLRRRPA